MSTPRKLDIPIGQRVVHKDKGAGRVVRGNGAPPPRGYVYVEFVDHLPSTSMLVEAGELKVAA